MPLESRPELELDREIRIAEQAIKNQSCMILSQSGTWFRRHPFALGLAIAAPVGLIGWRLWRTFSGRPQSAPAERGREPAQTHQGGLLGDVIKIATRGLTTALIAKMSQADVDVNVKTPANEASVHVDREDDTVQNVASQH
ncbi:MAG: hypothetical protein AB7N71_13095 [Phycisphaerae bacterium]